ncbi:MAG: type II toxin-antitoxin system VapC family toxin [Thermoleophilia bacterium]
MGEPASYYWDASALLSFLVRDTYTTAARAFFEYPALHVVSSLAYAETAAVLGRMARQDVIDVATAGFLLRSLDESGWRHVLVSPSRSILREFQGRSPLRGPDLWHLGLVLTLSREYGEFGLVSFDRRLSDAASAAGVPVVPASLGG